MILKKHQSVLLVPVPIHAILSVVITDHNGLFYPLLQILPTVMDSYQKAPKDGMPTYYTYQENKLYLYPRPEKEYPDFQVTYLPPARILGDEAEDGPSEISFGSPRHKKLGR